MTEKYFTVEQLALAYEEGWRDRHLNKAVAQLPFEQCWKKSNTLKHANEIVDAAKMVKAEAAARSADDPNRDGNQIEAMAQVLRDCRWFNYPDGTGEDKPVIWAEMLYDAAVHARPPRRVEPPTTVPEVKPLFRKIELTIHGNMSPAVMLASGLVQVIEHFASNVTVEQAEAALALSRTALILEAVDHNGARIHTGP